MPDGRLLQSIFNTFVRILRHTRFHLETLSVRLKPSEMVNEPRHRSVALAHTKRLRMGIATFIRPHVPSSVRTVTSAASSAAAGRGFLESVALEVTPRVLRVQRPILHTNPTEFLPTLPTRHVVAAFVFLNRRRTTWTSFRIRRHPQGIRNVIAGGRRGGSGVPGATVGQDRFRFFLNQLKPLRVIRTRAGGMGRLEAGDTEHVVVVTHRHVRQQRRGIARHRGSPSRRRRRSATRARNMNQQPTSFDGTML